MNVLISGCSFTHWPEQPMSPNNICWPSHLQTLHPDWNLTNVAEPGAGNQYIANSVAANLIENPNKYDLVLVMWSGVSRLDHLTSLEDDAWRELFDQYGFYRRVENCPDLLGYIFSGGYYGPWTTNSTTTALFKGLYKVSNKLSLAYTNLMEMLKTQHLLESKKVPYRFMSYVNYWKKDPEYNSPNGDFGVLGFRELNNIINEIDFSKWIFADEEKNGIYEEAKSREDYHGDRFHPGVETHKWWAELVDSQLPKF